MSVTLGWSRRRQVLLATSLAAALGLSACSGGGGSAGPTTTHPGGRGTATTAVHATLAAEVSSITTNGNQEIQADQTTTDAYTEYTYESADYNSTASYLEDLSIPESDTAAAQSVETDLQNESADAAQIASDVAHGSTDTADVAHLQMDEQKAAADVNVLRQKVGLSPATTTPTTPTPSTTTGSSTSIPHPTGQATTSTTVSGKTLLDQNGQGNTTTAPFTVPASTKTWTLAWTYDCTPLGASGNFIVDVVPAGKAASTGASSSTSTTKSTTTSTTRGSGANTSTSGNNGTTDIGPNELGDAGRGTAHYFDTGKFTLKITSECTWSVVAASA